jgi:hypothetical protein
VASGKVRAKMLDVEFRRRGLRGAAHHQDKCQHKDASHAGCIQQQPFQSGAEIGSNCPDTAVPTCVPYFDTQ